MKNLMVSFAKKLNLFTSKRQNSVFLIGIALFIILPLASGSLGTFKQNDCIEIRVLANCTSINLTEISKTNITEVINYPMGNLGGQTFNYTYCNTTELGIYTYSWNNPCLDCSQGNCGNDFEVTFNGKPDASEFVVVFFAILFIITLGSAVYFTLYNLGHLLKLDFDMIDLAVIWGIYFAIIGLYFLETFYMGNEGIERWLLLIINPGWIIMVMVPAIAFILSLTVGTLKKQRLEANAPAKIRLRRMRL